MAVPPILIVCGRFVTHCPKCEHVERSVEFCIAAHISWCSGRLAVPASCARTSMTSWMPSEMRWLFRQVRPFLRWHVTSFVCMSVGSFLALLSPLVLKWMIEVILPSRRVGLVVGAVGLIFLCHQGQAVLTTVGAYLTMVAAQRLALCLRLQLLRHLDTLSADYHEGTPVGRLNVSAEGTD
jgi:ABC-type bacteriocin/lantibiotic exporter with double-glycine peptidase domain